MLDQNATHPKQHPNPSDFVFKKEDVLEGIVTSVRETRPTQFLTWQISRVMRRDFYVMTSIMFRKARSVHYHTAIQHCLEDLRDEVNVIEHRVANVELLSPIVHSEAQVHIRSQAALELYEIMIDYDRALFKFQQHVTKEEAGVMFAVFNNQYGKLKRTLMPPKDHDSQQAGRGATAAQEDTD